MSQDGTLPSNIQLSLLATGPGGTPLEPQPGASVTRVDGSGQFTFWTTLFTSLAGLAPQRVTGVYLVALALKYGIRFATFDANLPAKLIARGSQAVDVIPV